MPPTAAGTRANGNKASPTGRDNTRRRTDACSAAPGRTASTKVIWKTIPTGLEEESRNVVQKKAIAKAVNKVVLAYSGGLDTSVILKWLQDTYGCEVVTFTADIGQG